MERFEFGQEVLKMAEKNLLYEVVKAFCSDKVDLSLENVDNMGMGYVFEELIRIGAEQSNEEAGEHFTPEEGKPNHIADITKIYDEFKHNDKRKIKTADGVLKEIIVSKIFDNEGFGYHKITVERPLRLNFQASAERIARLDEESGFTNLVKSQKKREEDRLKEIEEGKKRQGQIRKFLRKMDSAKIYKDRKEFLRDLQELDRRNDVRLSAPELQAVLNALSERDETAEICTDKKGNPEADSELRDTENIPLKETIKKYFEREVKPYIPDAWIDYDKTKIGYEIPMTRHFYIYEPPRKLDDIETDIKRLEGEIVRLLGEVTK